MTLTLCPVRAIMGTVFCSFRQQRSASTALQFTIYSSSNCFKNKFENIDITFVHNDYCDRHHLQYSKVHSAIRADDPTGNLIYVKSFRESSKWIFEIAARPRFPLLKALPTICPGNINGKSYGTIAVHEKIYQKYWNLYWSYEWFETSWMENEYCCLEVCAIYDRVLPNYATVQRERTICREARVVPNDGDLYYNLHYLQLIFNYDQISHSHLRCPRSERPLILFCLVLYLSINFPCSISRFPHHPFRFLQKYLETLPSKLSSTTW